MTATTTDTVAIATRAMAVPRESRIAKWFSASWPALLLAALILVLWELAVVVFQISEFKLAKPSAIALELVDSAGLLLAATWVTTQEILYGFLISIAVGVLLALIVVRYRWLDRALYPLIVLFQVVPKVALAPIFILWFGYGLAPKLWLIVVIAFFPITLNMMVGLKGFDPDLKMLMKSIGASSSQFLWRIQFPTSLPNLFAGLRIAITLCVIGAVVAEFSGASAGLGYLIQFASTQLDTPLMFAALTAISALGLVLYYAIAWLEMLLAKFYPHLKFQQAN
ncbi:MULTISPECIES: ABC transporter permease [unclassified Leucobacter]|uniref:ABC transporter permease n=1 Tax=unclassified Leucobacter TaxID=2621730 RepID=UPI00165D9584|nr:MULTISPECIES: ABC transporter permease [unclassified Leucobacter]MBC9926210.1 ABC transporter permease [Leucobacter sp. cx-169]